MAPMTVDFGASTVPGGPVSPRDDLIITAVGEMCLASAHVTRTCRWRSQLVHLPTTGGTHMVPPAPAQPIPAHFGPTTHPTAQRTARRRRKPLLPLVEHPPRPPFPRLRRVPIPPATCAPLPPARCDPGGPPLLCPPSAALTRARPHPCPPGALSAREPGLTPCVRSQVPIL